MTLKKCVSSNLKGISKWIRIQIRFFKTGSADPDSIKMRPYPQHWYIPPVSVGWRGGGGGQGGLLDRQLRQHRTGAATAHSQPNLTKK